MRDLDEAFVFWNELEQKYPVDRWRINGLAVWPLIRLQLATKRGNYTIDKKDTVSPLRQYSQKIVKVLLDKVKICSKDIKHQQKIEKADFVFLGDTGDRNVLMPDGTLLDHNHDPLKMYLQRKGYTVFSFEELGRDVPRSPRWSNSYYIDELILRCQCKKKLLKKRYKQADVQLEEYDDFLKELQSRNVDIKGLSIADLIPQVFFLHDLAAMFVKKLIRIKPSVVIHECWYSAAKMALSIAAHQLRIPVVEIQHGIAAGGRQHPSYYDWSKMPADGYELMPDYMWVWDKADYDAMNSWAKKSLLPFIGGHPMNLIWSDEKNNLSIYYQKRYEQEYGYDKPTILMTLQWGEEYPKWIIDFVNQHDEFKWLIRLHPVVDEYEKMFMAQMKNTDYIRKESPSIFPLEILLKNVDVHITKFSSVVLDAIPFKCPSVVFHPEAKAMYKKQIDDGIAYYVDNDIDLEKRIQLILKNRDKSSYDDWHGGYETGRVAINKILDIAANAKLNEEHVL